MDRMKARRVVAGATIVTASIATQQTVVMAQQRPGAQMPPAKIAERPLVVEQAWNLEEPIVIDGQKFESWSAYINSDFFARTGRRCGTVFDRLNADGGIAAATDCSNNLTVPAGEPIYAPAGTKYRIPVVFHNIRNGAGTTGNLTDTQIQSNIVVINEDFMALAGSPGAAGQNCQIEFFLTNDYGDTPGSGILRYNNEDGYLDSLNPASQTFKGSIAKDTANYFNIWSTNGAGALGFVNYLGSELPIGGGFPNIDGVTSLWTAVGDYCPLTNPMSQPYCTGRTITHELGHYLGLFHTFQDGCGSLTLPPTTPNCNTTGDRVCDTNATQNQNGNGACQTSLNTCGDGLDNVRNYMDYSDDTCMNNFTNEQARRMRCVLDNRRIALPFLMPIFTGNFLSTPNTLNPGPAGANGTTVCDLDGMQADVPGSGQPGVSDGAGDAAAAYTGSPYIYAGDEVGYKIIHPGGFCKLTLTGLTSDLDLLLLGAAGTPASTISVSTNAGTSNERIALASLAAGTYYAVVETFSVSSHSVYGSPYTIRYSRCAADVNGDNTVNTDDLVTLIGSWGACTAPCPPSCAADVVPVATGNCAVNTDDLLLLVGSWGGCP